MCWIFPWWSIILFFHLLLHSIERWIQSLYDCIHPLWCYNHLSITSFPLLLLSLIYTFGNHEKEDDTLKNHYGYLTDLHCPGHRETIGQSTKNWCYSQSLHDGYYDRNQHTPCQSSMFYKKFIEECKSKETCFIMEIMSILILAKTT